jgi:hypothetical protein
MPIKVQGRQTMHPTVILYSEEGNQTLYVAPYMNLPS